MKVEITFQPERAQTALSVWVHGVLGCPHPDPVSGKGYAVLSVQSHRDFFEFNSLEELDTFCEEMSKKILPSARAIAASAGSTWVNKVWISRAPKRDFKSRQSLVAQLRKSQATFERALQGN